MEGQIFVIILASCIIVGLFVTLFLQGAYVKHRLEGVERSRLGDTRGIDAACPDVSAGLRAYALKVACCKTRELNATTRSPVAITSGDPLPKDAGKASSRWLALHKTTAAVQLKDDAARGRVKYLVLGGKVARVAVPNLHEYFSEGERLALNAQFVVLCIAFAFPADLPAAVMPWQVQQSDVNDKAAVIHNPETLLTRMCGTSSSECSTALAVHAWAYGVTSSAVS
jgi:hypothetical protein